MNKAPEMTVSYNRADHFYRIMYELIGSIYKELSNNKIETAHNDIELLLINNQSFFTNKDEPEKCQEIQSKLDAMRTEIVMLNAPSTNQQRMEFLQRRSQLNRQLKVILLQLYELMHAHKMRVWYSVEDYSPSVTKRRFG